jgi:hypothetical protein
MKKIIMLLVVAALAISVPVFGQATEDGANCVTAATAQPTIPGGSTTSGLPDGGTVWGKQTGPTAGEAGAKGSHGWIKASGDPTTQKGRIEGRQTESAFSGIIVIDGANSKVCASANGTKVRPLG